MRSVLRLETSPPIQNYERYQIRLITFYVAFGRVELYSFFIPRFCFPAFQKRKFLNGFDVSLGSSLVGAGLYGNKKPS